MDDPVQWLPKNVWFSHDSAYPKQNMFERQVQLISCAGDKSVLIWSLRKPSSDDDELMDDHDQMHEQQAKAGVGQPSTGNVVHIVIPSQLQADTSGRSPAFVDIKA